MLFSWHLNVRQDLHEGKEKCAAGPSTLFNPVNAVDRADVDGFLDLFFRRAVREHDHGPAEGIIEDKDFRTNIDTGVAADAALFVDGRYAGHI